MKSVITISREYGSGGRFIGRMLADELSIPFYDNEIITLAAKESGYSEKVFEKAEQISTHSLLYSLSMFGSAEGIYGLPLSDKVYLVQSEIIKKCAEEGPCVIVGRCSDYVLRERDNVINFFIHSNMEYKIKRAVKFYGINEIKAQSIIEQKDKKRATYYNYYTSQRWGNIENYNMSINSDTIGVENAVKLLANYVRMHDGE